MDRNIFWMRLGISKIIQQQWIKNNKSKNLTMLHLQ